jgi:hypothetical protein
MLGAALCVVSMFQPWIVLYQGIQGSGYVETYEVSPLMVVVRRVDIASGLYVVRHHFFFGVDMTVLGFTIVGISVISVLCSRKRHWNTVFAAGLVGMSLVVFFPLVLPGHIPRMKVGLGMYLAFFGMLIFLVYGTPLRGLFVELSERFSW